MSDIVIRPELTPNPNAIKFSVNRDVISSGSVNFASVAEAKDSALATDLFTIDGVENVMLGRHFVSVTKTLAADWNNLAEPLVAKLKAFFEAGAPAMDPDALASRQEAATANATEAEKRIREILDEEIRPAIAMDGGDVVFHSYTDGVLTLHLQGACSACPSSTWTLKMGIENRLREEISDLREVVQLM
jgi:Fe-S cluster biogenesis protein NfuA